MRACWWQHTQAGPVDEDLGLWGCLHQPEEGRGAAPRLQAWAVTEGAVQAQGEREHPEQYLVHPH